MSLTQHFIGHNSTSRNASAAQRKQLRSWSGGACECCGFKPPVWLTAIGHSFLQVHHVIPVSQGGYTHMNNIVLLCPTCHKFAHGVKRAFDIVGKKTRAPFRSETQRMHYLEDLRNYLSTAESVEQYLSSHNRHAYDSYSQPVAIGSLLERHEQRTKEATQ